MDRGPALLVVSLVFTATAVCLVTARVYSRIFITRAPGLDDLFCILSLVSSSVELDMDILADRRNQGFGIALTVLVIIGEG